jgi:hypothetical protein
MIVEIDFTTDSIIRSSNIEEPDFITKFPAPDDYHPLEYDYIPQTAGVYDPNGFFLKTQSPIEEP